MSKAIRVVMSVCFNSHAQLQKLKNGVLFEVVQGKFFFFFNNESFGEKSYCAFQNRQKL